MEWRHAREVRGPHYYVRTALPPQMQGRGLGGALMGPTLERCDRKGLPAYIEASSERSAALYERLGFRPHRRAPSGGQPTAAPDAAAAYLNQCHMMNLARCQSC